MAFIGFDGLQTDGPDTFTVERRASPVGLGDDGSLAVPLHESGGARAAHDLVDKSLSCIPMSTGGVESRLHGGGIGL